MTALATLGLAYVAALVAWAYRLDRRETARLARIRQESRFVVRGRS